MLVSPMSNLIILLGFTLGGTLRGLITGVIVTLISLFFTSLSIHHLNIVIPMAILSAMVFSMGGLINAIYAKRFDDISFIPTFLLTPLTYLGGVFFSIKQLSRLALSIDVVPYRNGRYFRFGMLMCLISVFFGVFRRCFLTFFSVFWAWRLLHKGTNIMV